MSDVTFNRKHEADANHRIMIGELASRFYDAARATIEEGDQDEIFNAGLMFAREQGLTSQTMALVMAVLADRRIIVPRLVASWKRESGAYLGNGPSPGLADAAINLEIQTFVEQVDWDYAVIASELNRWFGILNQDLFGAALPPAAISIDRTRLGNLGRYRYGRDGLALKHRINLNSLHVERSCVLRLGVLAHEMVHQWEDVVHGCRRGNYHSTLYRERATEIGIAVTRKGHYGGIAPGGRFARLLAQHGIPLDTPDSPSAAPERAARRSSAAASAVRSTLVKWSCACKNVWVARATSIEIECLECRRKLARAAGGASSS